MLTKKGKAVFTPEPETGSVIAGSLCRLVVALCGAFGVCLMLNDSFRFTGGLHMLFVFIVCASCSLVAYLGAITQLTNRTAFRIFMFIFIAAVFFVINGVGIPKFFYYAPLMAWNRAIVALSDSGFSSLAYFMVKVDGTDPRMPGSEKTIIVAFVTLCAIINFIFVHSTVRKIRLMPPVITAAAVMTVCFTYNMMNENFAFLFIVAAGVGLLVLKYCGSFTASRTPEGTKDKDRKNNFRRSSISGVAGLVAAALVLAVGVYPAKKFKEPIGEIKAVESLVAAARSYLYGFITFEKFTEPKYASVSAVSTPVKPIERQFDNIRLFTLRSQTDETVYLRSWIGGDYAHGRWNVADPVNVPYDEDYMPEDSSELFYRILGVKEDRINGNKLLDRSHSDLGFVTSYVSLRNLGFATDMYYLPSRYSSYYGLLEFDDRGLFEFDDEPSFVNIKGGYSVKHNGMINLYMMSQPSYAAVAHLPYYRSKNFIYNMSKAITEYDFTVNSIIALPFFTSAMKDVSQAEVDGIIKSAEAAGITLSQSNIIYSLASMSPSSLGSLCEKIELSLLERANAYTHYTDVPPSEREYLGADVRKALGELEEYYFPHYHYDVMASSFYEPELQNGGFDRLYRTVYNIVTYLADNAEYTLAPHGYNDRASYIYQFLRTAKNGYCTQYASAAVLMLRYLGIPARYVEGFKTAEMNRFAGAYQSVIRDNHAHAWVEVYVPGPGWMTFEATEPMLQAMYGDGPSDFVPVTPGTDTDDAPYTNAPDTHGIDSDEPSDTSGEPPVTDGVTTGESGQQSDVPVEIPVRAILIAAAVFAVLSAVFAYLVYRKKKRDKLNEALRAAAKGGSEDPYSDTARFCDYIFRVLALLGLKRRKNELMSDFADRVQKAIGADYLHKGIDAYLKTVFAGSADENDCRKAAECALDLQITARARLKGLSRFINITLRKIV